MSNIKNEVIQKLRSDIRSKLDQIGAFVDNELADYIMVLVANQKTKYQMKDDLSLFLGAETDEFVNWLHNTLKLIQLNTEGEDKKVVTNVKNETKELSKSLNKIKSKTKRVDKNSAKSEKIGENSNNIEVNKEKSETIEDKDSNITTKSESTKESSKAAKPMSPQTQSQTNDNLEVESVLSDKQMEKQENNYKEQNDGEVVLHLNPDGGEVDELLQENDVNEEKKTQKKEELKESKEPKESKAKTSKSSKAVPMKRQAVPSAPTTPTSTIGAIVRHKPKVLEDDEYDTARPVVGSVASVVRVTQRKPSVPPELQAPKNLILRAMKAANDSTVVSKKRGAEELEYTPTPIKPIKKRLGERQEVVVVESDPKDLRNILNVSKMEPEKSEELSKPEECLNNRIVKQIQYKEINPQFVVTLDGVDHNKYQQNSDLDDQILLDEEMDDEFMESDNFGADEDLENNDFNDKVNERCRFWPNCKNGDDCGFQHPTTRCTAFPRCRYGDKCLYTHPKCKFDTICSRRDCPYDHSIRKITTSSALIPNLLPPSSVRQCKYASNCKNPACPYRHPKICHYGVKCRSHNCPFFHPNVSYSSMPAPVPHPHQFKWKAKLNHISERAFAASGDESKLTSTDTTD